jgi:uncharacterized membrane protein (UPF0127 family)
MIIMSLIVNNKKIIDKVKIADSGFERMKGLMFEDQTKFDYALVMVMPKEGRIEASIHMMFVFFPIDVLFLDSNKKIVDIVTLNPFHLNHTPKKASKYVIELPAKSAKSAKIGDFVSWSKSGIKEKILKKIRKIRKRNNKNN